MSEKVGIEINLIGAENAQKVLEQIETSVKRLGSKKTMIRLETGELVSVDERIKQIQDRLAVLGSQKKMGIISKSETQEMKRLNAELQVLQRGLKNGTTAAQEFKRTFNSMSSQIAHFGGSLQTLGNAFTRISSPFMRISSGLLMGIGYKALNMITEGFSGVLERADTMKNYPRMLAEFGFSAEESAKAITDLEQAVLGLPTGLDEIVAVQKRFVAASQDMDKATGLAIAYNNAILASGSDARQQLTAQRIITQLAGGAEIASSSWDALQRAIPLVFTELAKDSNMGVAEYVSALKRGTISTEEFMEAFTEIGSGDGTIANAARVMTKSWEGLSANITNATKRFGTAVLESLHEVFKEGTGRDLLDMLLGIDAEGNRTYDGVRDWIDGLSESLQKWIKAHPDEILEFFDALKSIDWTSIAKGFGQGMLMLANIIETFAKWGEGKDLSWIGRSMTRLSIWGKILTSLGGLIRGLRFPLAFVGTLGKFVGKGKVGIFGKIASIFGKKKDITAAGEAASAVPSVSNTFKSALNSLSGLIKVAGAVLISAGTAWATTKMTKSIVKDFNEIIAICKDIDWKDAAKVAAGMVAFIGGFVGISAIVGSVGAEAGGYVIAGEIIVGAITTIAAAFGAADMALLKEGIKNFADAVKILDEIPDIQNGDAIAGKVKNAVNVFNKVAEAFETHVVETPEGRQFEGGVNGVSVFESFDISNMSKALKSLAKSVKYINQLADVTVPEGAADNISALIGTVNEIASAFAPFATIFGISEAWSSSNIAKTMENIRQELLTLRKIAYHINTLASEDLPVSAEKDIITFAYSVGRIMTGLNTAFGQSWTLGWGKKVSTGNVKGTIENVRQQLILLRKMAYHINKLAATSVDTDGFSSTVDQIKTALESLKNINGDLELDLTVKLNSGFDKSVQAVVKKIKDAAEDIQNAVNKIPNTINKTVTVNLKGKASVTNTVGNGVAKFFSATGGAVYRAKGGGIPTFRRRGSDTVPAMLTPGEYVHNKKAVDTFGLDFMRKVNSLDVKGAMSDLMRKAGSMANVNRGTTITNNYNNNQRVVQNINTNSPDFAFRSASRFVGAF